ncbi:hypothetical protein ABB37_03817 [Leptomonas pyrrhocoris]|uniref:Uncharacterized protein n=1 Tax=Leptomonas pyrrhocoris TaxID=157538 RepID=A0A0M9G3F3_LEPPY|nr:hypothetical protein ABB37_03817 [Leptomonas pyrrhocoris]KPA81453.1 hypothetical protein ABB37_03817 [Leptomonas pyrrhocoris]|eukprot:XP_015659892.1 hypothetical protein ABB37_03817 [Leptomonas pyrrhocoris]
MCIFHLLVCSVGGSLLLCAVTAFFLFLFVSMCVLRRSVLHARPFSPPCFLSFFTSTCFT